MAGLRSPGRLGKLIRSVLVLTPAMIPGRAAAADLVAIERASKEIVLWFVFLIEIMGIAIIIVGVIAAAYFFLINILGWRRKALEYQDLRAKLGRAILLGLEFLVAADIINTVAIHPTIESLGSLAIIVLIRVFLSFALEVEIEGKWPWQRGARP